MDPTSDFSSTPHAPYLPREIVSAIVVLRRAGARKHRGEWRKDIQNLSLVRSDFVDPCQAALFAYVVIQPPSWTVNGVAGEGPDLASRFSELIAKRPQLGKYVLSLLYRLPSISRDIRDATEAPEALGNLNQVRYLHIEYEESREGENDALDWAHFTPTKWRTAKKLGYPKLFEAFKKLIGGEMLKTLILKNIRIPAEVLCKAKNLETLQLDGSDCHEAVEDGLATPLEVRTLFLFGSAPHDLGWDVCGESRYPISFAKLDSLCTAFGGKRYEEHAKKAMLGQASRLRKLELHTPDSRPFVASRNGNKHQHLNPLRHIHPDAFYTLTTLIVDIVFTLLDPSDVISDPWQGLCVGSTLRSLVAMKSLTVKVWIGGPAWKFINVDANFLNSRWKNLGRALFEEGSSDSAAPRRIKAVELVVGVHGDCRTAPRKEVDAFLPRIQRRASRLPWMPHLIEKTSKGAVSVVMRTARRHDQCRAVHCQG